MRKMSRQKGFRITILSMNLTNQSHRIVYLIPGLFRYAKENDRVMARERKKGRRREIERERERGERDREVKGIDRERVKERVNQKIKHKQRLITRNYCI